METSGEKVRAMTTLTRTSSTTVGTNVKAIALKIMLTLRDPGLLRVQV